MNAALDSRLLNLVIALPLLFAGLIALWPKRESGQIRSLTLIGMLASLATTIAAFAKFDLHSRQEFQLEYRTAWLSDFGVSYHVGIDGLSACLVLLTGILGPLVVLSTWTFVKDRVKAFHLAILIQQAAMLGALCSLDTLLFYGFFEATLIPMYFLIGIWGSEERRMAATKFFIYTMAGSVLLLIALLGLYYLSGPPGGRSFDYAAIYNALTTATREIAASGTTDGNQLSTAAFALFRYGPWFFFAFALAFAIKVPMFPLHTWLPDAHVQAPVAGSMLLAGILLKLGTYGFWRFAVPLFPAIARNWQVLLATLAVIGVVYGSLMCLAQRDVKRLIAYSSVSHLGLVMLGIFAFTDEGAAGSAYQMLNHGVSTSALFLLFGFLYERRHARLLSDYGGIAKVMPVFSALFLIVTFSSIAVPGTNGFVGEFLVLMGAFKSNLPIGLPAVAATSVILGAAYMLWMFQKVFFGKLTNQENMQLQDLRPRELVAVAPFIVLIFVMGLWPQPILDVLRPSSERFVARALYGSGGNLDVSKVRIRVLPAPIGATPTSTPAASVVMK